MGDNLTICGYALLVLVGIIAIRWVTSDRNRRGLSSTLVKLYGLVSVGGFAVLLAVTETPSDVKAGGFTLLGTIAGFLAGANVPDELGSKKTGLSNEGGDAQRTPKPREA